jgi:hypothetical protein
MNYDTEALTAAAKQVVADARRLGLTWTLQNGTVTSTSPIKVEMDGDNVSIQVASMIGSVSLGLRVYVIQVPPAGNFIVGFVGSISARWQAMSLLNGWTNPGGGNVAAQYRLVTSPPNSLQLVGVINAGTITNATTVATLPAGFNPNGNIYFPVATLPPGFGTAVSPSLLIDPSGNLKVFGLAGGTTAISFNALIPLDAS